MAMAFRLGLAALLIAIARGAPTTSLEPRAPALPADAYFSLPAATYRAAITCQDFRNRKGGIVYAIHGTGAAGRESWANGPYGTFLPIMGKTYDLCWVDLPNRAIGDAQLSAEYVAYGITYLAKKSRTKKISIIGHSQGAGLNPQWALTFWPSTRQYVNQYIALAPDFKGASAGFLLCGIVNVQGCQPSIWQQNYASKYLAAQNSNLDKNSGAQALVSTSALYTVMDEVIQPEVGPNPTSVIPGVTAIAMQDPRICGPGHVVEHLSMVVDPAAFALTFAALESNRPVNPATFNKAYCVWKGQALANFTNLVTNLQNFIGDVVVLGSVGVGTPQYPRIPAEPPLQQYVCRRGYTQKGTCVKGFTAGPGGQPPNYQ